MYQIVNKITGSMYVGSSINLHARWRSHLCALRQRGKAPPKLQKAWDKYGETAFEFRVVANCLPESVLAYEQIVIDELVPKYNTRKQAESNFGVTWSGDTNAMKSRKDTVMYTAFGTTASVVKLTEQFGAVCAETVRWRLARGFSIEDALTTPPASRSERGKKSAQSRKVNNVSHGADLEFNGVRGNLRQLVSRFGVVDYYAARARRRRGWSLERVLLEPRVSEEDRVARSIAGRRT